MPQAGNSFQRLLVLLGQCRVARKYRRQDHLTEITMASTYEWSRSALENIGCVALCEPWTCALLDYFFKSAVQFKMTLICWRWGVSGIEGTRKRLPLRADV